MEITTQKQIRKLFWETYPEASHKKINYNGQKTYVTDTRCLFVDFLDYLARSGQISEKLAQRATLS